jgi:hypothetical protein
MRGAKGTRSGAAALLLTALLWPAPAHAHGLVQRADLPIPEWLFGWAAAIVLVVSFAALAALWPKPRLENAEWRPIPGGRFLGSRAVEIACGAIGVALFAVVMWAAFAGVNGPQDNLAPTFVLIIFWVGLVFLSILFGDVFRAFNPWRAIGRVLFRDRALRAYPERLGRWPAALGLLGFTWIELCSGWGEVPRDLGLAAAGYSVITLAAMFVYGTEPWARHGEAFSVYYNLFSRLSVFETRDRIVGIRPLLSGLPKLDIVPGTVAVVAVMIGTVTFDGLSQGNLWRQNLAVWINDGLTSAGLGLDPATKLTATAGLLLGVGLIAGFYALGIRGAQSVGGGMTAERLSGGFVHSLVPIAMVYVAAHYLTFLIFQGQAVTYLASDPLGHGWNLFGTASAAIDYSVLSQNATWYVQVGFVVLGHVAALVLAHDRALVLYGQARQAVRSQYWMLGIMVGFTTLALWLLAQANA